MPTTRPTPTPIERIIIANQWEILGHLKEDPSYTEKANNIRSGHKFLYGPWLDISVDLPDSAANGVLDALALYEALAQSFDTLANKQGIDAASIKFPGFDGNTESELFSFGCALHKAETYAHVMGDRCENSHHPTTDMYARMVSKWKELGRRGSLDADSIKMILAEQVHPSNRG